MTVVSERERSLKIGWQRLEAAEMRVPPGLIEGAKPDALRPAVVEEARDGLRESGGLDFIIEVRAERQDLRVGSVGSRSCHRGP